MTENTNKLSTVKQADSIVVSVGDIIKDAYTEKRYRVISIYDKNIVLCEMDISCLKLNTVTYLDLIDFLQDQTFTREKEEDDFVFNLEDLPQKTKEQYSRRQQMVNEVMDIYRPTFIGLDGRGKKPELEKIIAHYSCPRNTFWRILTKYLQSGMSGLSLIDSKLFGCNKGKTYSPEKKAGRKAENLPNQGIPLKEEDLKHFDEALSDYKSGREKTLKKAFLRMSIKYYSAETIRNGRISIDLLPATQRPTLGQFYYYVEKVLTKEEKDRIKTSAQEQRNNKRLLESDSLKDVHGPGDLVEIDACEDNASLVSVANTNQTVGRPTVYFMIDVYTREIVAVSISFERDSYQALTNLFLNMADNKDEFCRKYGIAICDPVTDKPSISKIWHSGFVPRRVRCDRGSDFKSKAFTEFCNANGIQKDLVPGGTGSMKGNVEQSFNQLQEELAEHLEHRGLITKRHDSKHHKEACLTIEQYTEMVLLFVIKHNQHYMKDYPMTKEMADAGVEPRPASLWEYGIEKYGSPKPIKDKEQYLFTAMKSITASLSRKGITYKGLVYFPENDPELKKEMFRLGKKTEKVTVKIDPRCMDAVYYIKENRLMRVPLNPDVAGNHGYENMTLTEYELYRKAKKKRDIEELTKDQNMDAYFDQAEESVARDAEKAGYSNDKNMRKERAVEKAQIEKSNKIENRLSSDPLPDNEGSALPELEDEAPKEPTHKAAKNAEEALNAFFKAHETD